MEESKKTTGTSATRAKNKYKTKAYDRMELLLPKGTKEKIAELVKQGRASSNNNYVVTAVLEKMKREESE